MDKKGLHIIDRMILIMMAIMLSCVFIANGQPAIINANNITIVKNFTETVGPGPKVKKNKATYGRSQGTYRPKSFYSWRKAPKKKSAKNMPSATRHIG